MKINRPQAEQDSVDVCILALAETFDRKPTDALLNAYQIGLQDIPVAAIEDATAKAIHTLTFMPKPVELRRLCGELSPEDRAIAAWQAVCDAISKGYNSYDHVDFDDGLCNATIRNMGGWVALLSKTEEEFDKWAKQDFIKTYQAFMRVGVNGDACRPLVGLADIGVHEVRYGDGTTAMIDLGGAKKVETGLPTLTSPNERLGHRPEIPQLALRKPLNESEAGHASE